MDQFDRIAIIGMGLIGGSLAIAIKKKGFNGKIIGSDRLASSLEKAKAMGTIDIAAKNIKEAVTDAKLVVIAVPIEYYSQIFEEIAPYLSRETIVTDMGSVKSHVNDIALEYLPNKANFVGGHPMAGSEKTGIKAATPFLYENVYYFLTPTEITSLEAVSKVRSLIEFIGAYPVMVSPEEHDSIAARISHLPHLMAVMLVNMLDKGKRADYLPFAGGGFRDTTRIASGNPDMYKNILRFNKDELIQCIEDFEKMLMDFKSILIKEEMNQIFQTLEKAKMIRDSIPRHSKDYMPPLYEIFVSEEDRPGILAKLTKLMGENNINISEIEIHNGREGKKGAIRIGIKSYKEGEKALSILKKENFVLSYSKRNNENDNYQ